MDGAATKREDGQTPEAACLNCGAQLIGPCCHACGQGAHVHKTLGAFFHDLVHGVLHFEGKAWHTLPLLAWQPGRLTRDYIDGKRIRHISPVALFLFSVFLMFAVVKSIGGSAGDGSGGITVNTEIGTGLSRIDADLARLERERATLAAQGRNTAALENELAEQRAARSGLAELAAGRLPIGKAGSDIPALDRALKAFAQNPSLLLYKLQANTYKFSWALIPISALFVWLLFPFSKRFGAYDHTVFVTYSLSFMALLVALLTIVEALGLSVAWLAMIAVPPLHMYRQLRGTYGLSRAAAAWRTVALAIFALLALALFGMLMLAKSG